jgi:enolase
MHKISNIEAREILDSRGIPTIEAKVILEGDVSGVASVPSGASTGSAEALELRDGDQKRYMGKGVRVAIEGIRQTISPALVGKPFASYRDVDQCMLDVDGTANKSHLGANAILAVSLAAAKAMAKVQHDALFAYLGDDKPRLPVPMMNIINGGAHADNNLDFQEFMIMPVGLPSFSEALRAGVEVFYQLKSILQQQGLSTSIGDEGGFAPNLRHHEQAVTLILEAIEKAGYKAGKDMFLALDVASTEFYQEGQYHLGSENKIYDSETFVTYLENMVNQFPILSIEDGMAENDWEGWAQLSNTLGNRAQLVGDDLFVTNTVFLKRGIEQNIANAILIKPNQIGSLSETFDAITMAKGSGYNSIISHRSGETEDTSIADIAVATAVGQIKTGSVCRSERVAKYNRLLAIEAQLGEKANYAGRAVFAAWLK